MFLMSDKAVFIDFNESYCTTSIQILSSKQFKRVVNAFITHLNYHSYSWWNELKHVIPNLRQASDEIIDIFKLLLVFHKDEIIHPLMEKSQQLYRFVSEFYDYWRNFERYATVMHTSGQEKGIASVNFIDSYSNFNKLVLLTYRRISERLIGQKNLVYRQLAAGSDCGIILKDVSTNLPEKYHLLQKIPVISSVVFDPPFIAYTKSSKRSGVFKEIDFNPLNELTINRSKWFCYPLNVGRSLALVYFHKDYTNIGISLANLFEAARPEEYLTKKPDIIYIHGGDNPIIVESCFYHDKDEKIYLGYSPYSDEVTYFGYMKKMLLTLYNLKKIDDGELPIHGAMMSIEFKNGITKNVIIMGDSGAGKSETIEALRQMAHDDIRSLNIIFDDMGTIAVKDNKLYGYGTEIGAFVRLDDLDTGYAYKKIDRAIFLNPDKENARTIIPTTLYEDIIKGYSVDMFLYANNYEDKEGMKIFDDIDEAKKVYIEGKRKALGTTTECGIVTTFFANPFGPYQRQEETKKLIDFCFSKLKEMQIPVGEIYTQLGIEGKKNMGPKNAAIELLKYIKK